MKKLLAYFTALLLMSGVFVACDDDDDADLVPPEIAGATISDDNSEINISFSKGVYLNDDGSGDLDQSAFELTAEGGDATIASYNVDHTAGETAAVINVTYDGVFTGNEIITIAPSSIYDADGAEMESSQTATVSLKNLGIAGEWYSSGDNVAPLLVNYFAVDSIYATFNVDQTYVVESYDAQGVMTEYTGTYEQAESDVEGIWTITLNQSTPTSVTSEGIFGFFLDETAFDMKYEVVQTSPDLGNSSPTPDAGFGSSNGGALGETNIQKFIRVN